MRDGTRELLRVKIARESDTVFLSREEDGVYYSPVTMEMPMLILGDRINFISYDHKNCADFKNV